MTQLETAFLMGWQGVAPANPYLATSETSDCYELGVIFRRNGTDCDFKTLVIKKSRGDSYRVNGALYKITYKPFKAVRSA